MRIPAIAAVLTVIFLVFNGLTMHPLTSITSFTPGPSSIGRYEKYEATFTISRIFPEMPDFAYPDKYDQARQAMLPYYPYDPEDIPAKDPGRKSPYGIDGISIDALLTSPTGKKITLPAFYYQDFARTNSGGSEIMTPTNSFSWKIRFAPDEIGPYTYVIRIQDKSGTWTSQSYSFKSIPSGSPGFVRISPRDNRFLEFDNGESFIPISAGAQWWSGVGRSYDYETIFKQFGQHKVNFARIWDQNDGFSLTVEGPFDSYQFPDDFRPTDNALKFDDSKFDVDNLAKGTQMNQRGNFEEDRIIEAAKQNGIYVQLASHGDAYWIWDASVYDYPDGTATDAADWRHINYWKRNFRYRVARWGYSTAILAWEHWNELGHVPPGSDWFNFYQIYARYQQATDPYRHLRTTSQNSQAYSPGLWSSPAMDVVNYHDYLDERYQGWPFDGDSTNMVYRFAQCLRNHASVDCELGLGDGSSWSGSDKPILWTEWDQINPTGFDLSADHNAMWAGLFSPIGMVPIDWYFEDKVYKGEKLDLLKIAADYFSTIDYAGEKFSYASTSDVLIQSIPSEIIETTNSAIRALVMRNSSGEKAFIWSQNKNFTVKGSTNPSPISGVITVPQMENGSYRLEFWDTSTGAVSVSSTTVSDRLLRVPISNLSKSVAIKAIHASSKLLPAQTP